MEDDAQPSFKEFMSTYAERRSARFGVTTKVQQDLFSVPENVSLAHCVTQDVEMTKGISSVLNRNFGLLDEQQPKVGRVLRLEDGSRYLLYILTRKSYTDRPSYENIWRALTNLKKIVCNYDITNLAWKIITSPKIGHGVENLDWKIVRSILEVVFRETGIRITVCCMNPKMSYPSKTVDY
ncbi:ADP-ribose glycohydrolase OARD1-like [Diabrotica virgifera virgifera]|uniref:Macro domain-containing protein n=1 Tax=Diabrotica virgifera virgifera TaxID=50390 RepID=A0ABM5JYM8_DIAVI|nr:ADP-ribose glycohydrolase OARD1-like [Diabrotica virgifera virgifera]